LAKLKCVSRLDVMCGQTMALNASVTSGHTSHTLNYVFESLTFICVLLMFTTNGKCSLRKNYRQIVTFVRINKLCFIITV